MSDRDDRDDGEQKEDEDEDDCRNERKPFRVAGVREWSFACASSIHTLAEEHKRKKKKKKADSRRMVAEMFPGICRCDSPSWRSLSPDSSGPKVKRQAAVEKEH